MASWFDSVGQSIGNFVSGHGFEDNAQKAIIDAQNEKKRRDEQQAALNRQVVQQRPIPQPQAPNNILNPSSIDTSSIQPVNQPIIQQPIQPVRKPPVNNGIPTGLPTVPNATINKPLVPAIPQVQVQPAKPNIFQQIGGFFGGAAKNVGNFVNDTVKNTSGMVNDFATDPNNVPRNVIDYITGQNNPLDGATYDYRHMVNGKPILIPKAPPANFNEGINQSLAGTLVQKVIIDPTQQGLGLLGDVAVQGGGLIGSVGQNNDTIVKQANTVQKIRDWIHSLKDTSGANIAGSSGADQSAAAIASGRATPGDFGNVALTSINTGLAASLLDPANFINPIRNIIRSVGRKGETTATTDLIQGAEKGLLPSETPTVNPTIETPRAPLIESTNPETKLLTEKSTVPRSSIDKKYFMAKNDVLTSDGASGFITKTPQQIADTERAISGIKNIDTKLNVIRQGQTSNIEVPQVRSLMKQRNDLLSVATGDRTLQEATAVVPKDVAPTTAVSDTMTTPNTADLSNPGAVPTDGVITSNPTNADLTNIIDNTINPTVARAPKPKLTPQNEMPGVTQAPADNFTGELGVNKNGQIYQKVSQAEARDTAVKNLLDGKTPEEYLATARQTGQADSAELAILMEQTPKDSPVWAELASIKGKLGTQKGQALALLERTMRESSTSEQLASRTLQKANTAGFDTTQIAGDISNINKTFTDARDAYNMVLNDASATNADIQTARDAFYKVTKQSFTDESNVLSKLAKTKEQKNLAYQLQKKSDVYLQGMATSSLTSSPVSVMRNFAQGVGALTHQAGLAPKVEALINRLGGGSKIGSFDAAGAKVGFKTGVKNLSSEFLTRASQLGITKNPVSWVKHPIGTIRQLTTTGTELGNIPMESAIRGGMSSEYRQILESQGFKGAELKTLTERNTITDPLNIRTKYAKEINDLNGLSSEVDRTGGTFRDNIKNQFTKLGVTDKTSYQLADFIDRDIFGFFKPTLIVGKKTADYATGGVAHLVPAITKLARGDKAGFISEISKTIATAGVTLPVLGATGYVLAKAGVLTQNSYGEWQIGNVPISGYVGAFGGPMAMGAIVGQNLHDNNGDMNHAFDGFGDKAYKTIINTYPYGQAGQKLGAVADVIGGVSEGIRNGQAAYGFKEGVASLLGGLGKELVPASSFLNLITKMLGGNVKKTTVDNPKNADVWQAGAAGVQQSANQVMSGIPGLGNSGMLPDKTNSFGETMKKPNAGAAFLGATNDSIAQSDAATGITAVGSKDLNSVAKTNLTTVDERTAYNNIVKRLEKAGDQVTDTNVFKEFVKDKNYLLAAKYDSNIDPSIDDADKTALAKYDALDADHQKIYIENQKNALDTYTAQLNNKQANGTLSKDDTKTFKVWGGTGDGNSLLVRALVAKTNVDNNVSADTLNLYEQVTSKKDYNNLSSEQRAALDKYAAQLKANGVMVRDFLAGGSGSGSGGSKAKGASNVPLTKAVTSGSGGSGKFAHQDINVNIPQVVKPAPQYIIKQRKISVG